MPRLMSSLKKLVARFPQTLCRIRIDGVRHDTCRGAHAAMGLGVVHRRDIVVDQKHAADLGEQRAGRGEHTARRRRQVTEACRINTTRRWADAGPGDGSATPVRVRHRYG